LTRPSALGTRLRTFFAIGQRTNARISRTDARIGTGPAASRRARRDASEWYRSTVVGRAPAAARAENRENRPKSPKSGQNRGFRPAAPRRRVPRGSAGISRERLDELYAMPQVPSRSDARFARYGRLKVHFSIHAARRANVRKRRPPACRDRSPAVGGERFGIPVR